MATDALTWFRENVCEPKGHDHDAQGELDCLLDTLHRLRSGDDPSEIVGEAEPDA